MLPHLLLLCAVIIWGWTFVFTKILLAELGPVAIIAMRLAIGLPFLGLLLLVKRVPLRFERADVAPLMAGGAIMTLHFLMQAAGLITTTASNRGWIISVTPLALAVLSCSCGSASADLPSPGSPWPPRAFCCWCRAAGSPIWIG